MDGVLLALGTQFTTGPLEQLIIKVDDRLHGTEYIPDPKPYI